MTGPGRREVWVVLLVVAALTLTAGLQGRLGHEYVNWDGLAATAHANDVFRSGRNANLAMIGFVQPPLPALLQLPLVLLVPALATSGIAANLVGAIAAGVAAALLLGLCAEAGLGRRWRWPLVALFALHPMVLGPAACGAPIALLTALLLGAAWGLLRWSRTEALRDLIATSLALSGALLTRYEAAFIVLGAMVYIAWRVRRSEGSWSKLEGTMITFGLPIAYVAGIWVIANWAIMGDPWHFARETFGAASDATAEGMLTTALGMSIVCFFPILALVYNQMRGAGRLPAVARPIAWLVVTALTAPALAPGLFGALGELGDWSRLATTLSMVLAGGYALLAYVVGERLRGEATGGPVQGTLVIAAASLGVAVWLASSGMPSVHALAGAYSGRGLLSDSAADELSAARELRGTKLPAERRHLVVGWPGFAVVLLSGRTGEITPVRMEEVPAEAQSLWAGSRVVLLTDRDADGASAEAAEAAIGLPAGLRMSQRWRAGPWRCYVVVRAGDDEMGR